MNLLMFLMFFIVKSIVLFLFYVLLTSSLHWNLSSSIFKSSSWEEISLIYDFCDWELVVGFNWILLKCGIIWPGVCFSLVTNDFWQVLWKGLSLHYFWYFLFFFFWYFLSDMLIFKRKWFVSWVILNRN